MPFFCSSRRQRQSLGVDRSACAPIQKTFFGQPCEAGRTVPRAILKESCVANRIRPSNGSRTQVCALGPQTGFADVHPSSNRTFGQSPDASFSGVPEESRNTETASTRVFLDAEPGVLALPPYSVRNACIGSIRDALHAGTRQASPATASSVAATVAKILGSSGRVP